MLFEDIPQEMRDSAEFQTVTDYSEWLDVNGHLEPGEEDHASLAYQFLSRKEHESNS